MEAEEAERVLRTVNEAAGRALHQVLVKTHWAPAFWWETPNRATDAQRAALQDLLDEFDASVESVLTACAAMVSHEHAHLDTEARSALATLLKIRSEPDNAGKLRLLAAVNRQLDPVIRRLDPPQPELGSAPIGSRPPGPGFYQRQQARAEAAAEEQRRVTARPGGNPANGDSVPGTVSPYDDLREPWYRRLLGRNRGRQ
ncbi:hypothetical protein [Streptomyces sp. BK208]|uniref:hypothetical protein n=1 Tax=Streptomyces sp. BK208 TaxID=2512150 RepID=UPI00105F13EB|nr:hypothetical protein [Streptomyces sp. BK208]